MKKRILTGALALLLAAIAGGGTLAYTTVEAKATNVITSGGVDITLHESTQDGRPFPQAGIQGVVPGASYSKIVRVENAGDHSVWVCVLVEPEVRLADGSRGNSSCLSLDIDKTHWDQGEDGIYYYKKPLAPGRFTLPLFTEVTFDQAMGNRYQGSRVQIHVEALATQSEHNGDTVWEAKGWPSGTSGGIE